MKKSTSAYVLGWLITLTLVLSTTLTPIIVRTVVVVAYKKEALDILIDAVITAYVVIIVDTGKRDN